MLERILDQGEGVDLEPAPEDADEEYARLIRDMINDAQDYEESFLQLYREENQAYYDGDLPSLAYGKATTELTGDPDIDEDDVGRSRFVSTDVRDTILAIMPSLMRIFASADNVGDFIPLNEGGTEMATSARDYINHVFMKDNEGFMILYSVFMDALTKAAGFTEWWTDNSVEVDEKTYQNITPEDLQLMIAERPNEIQIVDRQFNEETQIIESVTVRYIKSKPVHIVEAFPPEEFRITRYSRTARTADLIGREQALTPSDLIKMGYNLEDFQDYIGGSLSATSSMTQERIQRNPALIDDYKTYKDMVRYGRYFVRADKDGDGIDELRLVCTVGDNHHIIMDQIVPWINLAVWSVQPIPHTVLGEAVADLIKDIQQMKSFMVRGLADNLAETTNPKMVINELLTNIDDALNDEVGGVIRTRGAVNDSVAFSRVPYVGAELQENINYMDNVRASRTGITEASKGLDPGAMQSTALTGINAIIAGAQERIELIARVLAETGWKDTMMGLLREVTSHPNPERSLRINNKWKKFQPSTFDPNMSIEINPTLGKGSDMVKLQALMGIEQAQAQVFTQFGPQNSVVTPEELMNTQEDKLALVNIRDFGRYFKRMTPEQIAAMQQAPKEPDPATLLAQSQLQKVNAQLLEMQAKMEQMQSRFELDTAKAIEEADFKRDKLNVDTALEAAKIMSEGAEEPEEAEVSSMNRSPNAQ